MKSFMTTVLEMLQKPIISLITPTDAYTAVNPGSATTDGAALNSQGELGVIGSSGPSSSVLIRALAEQPPPRALGENKYLILAISGKDVPTKPRQNKLAPSSGGCWGGVWCCLFKAAAAAVFYFLSVATTVAPLRSNRPVSAALIKT